MNSTATKIRVYKNYHTTAGSVHHKVFNVHLSWPMYEHYVDYQIYVR